jgi:hypothetical protein
MRISFIFAADLDLDAELFFSWHGSMVVLVAKGVKRFLLRRDRNNGSGRENPRTLAITNGPASTIHSALVQPEGGTQDIVTREWIRHSEGIFLTK